MAPTQDKVLAAAPAGPIAPKMPELVCKPVVAKPQFLCQDASFKCQECSQSFDTEHALNLHVKYIHRSKED
eukprot:symbB.v1.2.027629.t1/scaffold2846.1/size68995/1